MRPYRPVQKKVFSPGPAAREPEKVYKPGSNQKVYRPGPAASSPLAKVYKPGPASAHPGRVYQPPRRFADRQNNVLGIFVGRRRRQAGGQR